MAKARRPDKAVATVNFKNINEPAKVVLNLVKVKNEWRTEKAAADGTMLRQAAVARGRLRAG